MQSEKIFNWSNRTYDIIRWIVQITCPAFLVLLTTVGAIWEWARVDAIVQTLAAVNLFLGVSLKISSNNYTPPEPSTDGILLVNTTDPEKDTYTFEMETPLFDLQNGDVMNLRVVQDD